MRELMLVEAAAAANPALISRFMIGSVVEDENHALARIERGESRKKTIS
jgi:hypothetical protein